MQTREDIKKQELTTRKDLCNIIVAIVPVSQAGAIPQRRDAVLHDVVGDHSPSQADGFQG